MLLKLLPQPLTPAMRRIYTKIVWAFVALCSVAIIGTLGYKLLAGNTATWLDCLYMTVITITTVGYGEVIDMSHMPEGRVFTMFVSGAGLGALWFMFSSVTAMLLENDINQAWGRRRMEQQIKKLHGHYIICGFGRVGRNVAAELDATHRHYVAIDQDVAMLEQHKDLKQPGLLYLTGDASDDEMLELANVRNAAGVFAVTGDDSRNLMIVITARHLNPNARLVARCHEVRNFDKITRAGAHSVVSPDFTGGMRIASAMIRPTVVNFLDEMMRGQHDLRVEEVPIPTGFTPRPLGALHLQRGDNFVLLAVRNGEDWLFNPDNDFILQPGQAFIIMASASGRVGLEQTLMREP